MRLLAMLACLFAQSAHASPRLVVPADLSAPNPSPVRLEGVEPGARVEIMTERSARDGKTRDVGEATYTADAEGRVDTGSAAALNGSYADVEPLGLFWSATSRPARANGPAYGQVRITASIGGTVIASASAGIGPDPATITTSSDTPFPGAIWSRPASTGRHPVVIVLGGSEGGSSTARKMAPLFAARGYATLGLPYYDPGYDPSDRIEGLPRSFTDIPVDRLAAVRAWLATRPDADASRIALWGVSKGAEFALIAASRYDWIRAVVAIVPTDLVWEGWGRPGPTTASFSFEGKPLAFEPYAGMEAELAKAARGERMDLRRVHLAGRAAHPERVAAARIPVERFRGSLLVVGGRSRRNLAVGGDGGQHRCKPARGRARYADHRRSRCQPLPWRSGHPARRGSRHDRCPRSRHRSRPRLRVAGHVRLASARTASGGVLSPRGKRGVDAWPVEQRASPPDRLPHGASGGTTTA